MAEQLAVAALQRMRRARRPRGSASDNENFINGNTVAIVSGVRLVANALNHFFFKPATHVLRNERHKYNDRGAFHPNPKKRCQTNSRAEILVVDDDAMSRRAAGAIAHGCWLQVSRVQERLRSSGDRSRQAALAAAA